MELEKITSKKHPGAIFLRYKGQRNKFLGKIYPQKDAEMIANSIIKFYKDENEEH